MSHFEKNYFYLPPAQRVVGAILFAMSLSGWLRRPEPRACRFLFRTGGRDSGTVRRGLLARLTRFQDFRRLEQQNKLLEAANRLKSEFLANMSHEIRTPMNAVINFSSLILEGTYGEINEELKDAVEEIDQNGVALLALINDILDLAKIEAGAMKLKLTECEPEDLLLTAVSGLEYEAQEKGLKLETKSKTICRRSRPTGSVSPSTFSLTW